MKIKCVKCGKIKEYPVVSLIGNATILAALDDGWYFGMGQTSKNIMPGDTTACPTCILRFIVEVKE